jgi:exosortase/archaeosortase family protein
MTLLGAGILAYPASARWKIVGLLGGVVVLWTYNLIRIYAMFAIDGLDPDVVEFIHIYVWQTVTVVFACALFLWWLQRAPSRAGQ